VVLADQTEWDYATRETDVESQIGFARAMMDSYDYLDKEQIHIM
jgi:hypothetical protein